MESDSREHAERERGVARAALRLASAALPGSAAGAFLRTWLLSVAFGFVVLFAIVPLTGISEHFYGPTYDGYIEIASALVRGHGFVFEPGGAPVLHRPPLYPLLLAPLTLLPAPAVRPALVVWQSAMLGGIAALVFWIARRSFGPRVASFSVLLLWTDPFLFWVVKNPMSVVLQGLLSTALVAGVTSLARNAAPAPESAGRRPRWREGLWIGGIAGGLALTHGAMLTSALVLLAASLVIAIRCADRALLACLGAAALAGVAVLAPWTLRNWIAFDRLVPVAGNAGYAYFLGNAYWDRDDPCAGGTTDIKAAALRLAGVDRTVEEVDHFYGIRDADLDADLNRRMVRDVLGAPLLFARKVALNAAELYLPLTRVLYMSSVPAADKARCPYPRGEMLILGAMSLYHLGLWVLALAPFAAARYDPGERRARALLLLCVASLVLPYLPFLPFRQLGQYVFHTIPVLAILAASAWVPRSET